MGGICGIVHDKHSEHEVRMILDEMLLKLHHYDSYENGIFTKEEIAVGVCDLPYASPFPLPRVFASEDTVFLKVVESYLPQLMSEEKITSFINSNIDVGSFKNIMQAMGPIMKQLKGKADGNTVKAVLMKMS